MLTVNNISVGYIKEKTILKDIRFAIKKGEVICIMGESGSGKSTLLKAIYGLLDLEKGSINWRGKYITGPSENLVPGVEDFKYVPQDFDLMPYVSVTENVGKYLPRFNMNEYKKRVHHLLEIIEMTEYANTLAKDLSGGQQQRVAIARALAIEPKLLLLDEPFGQVDNFKKNIIRRNLFMSLKEENIPCIISTHDGDDALSFADKLVILKDGKVVVTRNPKELYENPYDEYSASLLDDINNIDIKGQSYLLYPSQIEIVEWSNFPATVLQSYFKGSYWLIECFYDKQKIYINHHESIRPNKSIYFKFKKVLRNYLTGDEIII